MELNQPRCLLMTQSGLSMWPKVGRKPALNMGQEVRVRCG